MEIIEQVKYVLNKSGGFLFFLTIVLLPFNDLPYFKKILGELSVEGAFYPLALAMLLYGGSVVFSRNKIKIPRHISVICLLTFLLWIGVSGLANLHTIFMSVTKGRTGIEKLLLQMILMVFVTVTPFLLYNLALKIPNFFNCYRKYIIISFAIVAIYSVIELLFLFGNELAKNILEYVNKFIHNPTQPLLYFDRVRSVSGEASWFAIYCGFIFPWLLSYIYTARKQVRWSFGLITYFFVLILLTFSRTAYVIIITQLILFLILSRMFQNKPKKAIVLLILFGVAWLFVFFYREIYALILNAYALLLEYFHSRYQVVSKFQGFYSSVADVCGSVFNLHSATRHDLSNIGRYGSMVAALKIGMDHLGFGVGLGQYGFYMAHYVPNWAKVSYEMKIWMSTVTNTLWAPVHNIYARIFAELGIIGLGIWLFLWLSILYACWKKFRLNCKIMVDIDIVGVAVILSIVGVMLLGLNLDSFRVFEYWIVLSVAWVYLASNQDELNKSLYD